MTKLLYTSNRKTPLNSAQQKALEEQKKRDQEIQGTGFAFTKRKKKPAPVKEELPLEKPKATYVPGVLAAPERKVYTGDKIVGIATMHKSNMVPVFSGEEAKDISRMRRG